MLSDDELRALADALEPMARAPRFEDFDVPGFCAWVRACADAKPVARLLHWHGPKPDPRTVIVARTFDEYSVQEADDPKSYWKNGEPLYTHPAPAAPQAEPIDPHMIVADDRFPDEQAEPKREPLSDDIISYEHACRSSYEPTCAASDFNSFKLGVRFAERAHGTGGSDAE